VVGDGSGVEAGRQGAGIAAGHQRATRG
jgi:hypothetical protein